MRKSQILGAVLLVAVAIFGFWWLSQTEIERSLGGTEWEVADSDGFPPDGIVEGTFRMTRGIPLVTSARFSFDDGVNIGSSSIEWTETGFEVVESGTSTLVGSDQPRLLGRIMGGVGDSTNASLDGETLTLRRGELVVVATPGRLGERS